ILLLLHPVLTALTSDASFVRLDFANFGSTNARNNHLTSPPCSLNSESPLYSKSPALPQSKKIPFSESGRLDRQENDFYQGKLQLPAPGSLRKFSVIARVARAAAFEADSAARVQWREQQSPSRAAITSARLGALCRQSRPPWQAAIFIQ